MSAAATAARPLRVRPDDELVPLPRGGTVLYRDTSHRYWHTDGEPTVGEAVPATPLPGVTSILGVLSKPALVNWAERVTADGVLALAADGGLPPDRDALLDALGERGLRHHQQRDAAAERGHVVHEAARRLAEGREVRLGDVPEPHRGYVRALLGWWSALLPEPIGVEQIVASTTHGYAGRCDLRCRLLGDVRLDYKTGPRVYLEALLQVQGYELAAVEMGHRPTEAQLVVRLGEQGDWETVRSTATAADWLAVLGAWRTMRALSAATDPRRRTA